MTECFCLSDDSICVFLSSSLSSVKMIMEAEAEAESIKVSYRFIQTFLQLWIELKGRKDIFIPQISVLCFFFFSFNSV